MKLVRSVSILVIQICFAILFILCKSQSQPIIAPGEYLRTDYISALKATKSPFKSMAHGSTQLLIVNKDTNGIAISSIFNFREGGLTFLMKPDGKIAISEGVAVNPLVEIVDSQHIKLGYDTFPKQTFDYVGNAERFAAEICLVGQFLDKYNKKYIFMNDGTVLFPQNKFRYYVGLDYSPTFHYNYFTAESKTDTSEYAFLRQNDTLILFNILGGDIMQGGRIDFRSIRYLKKQ